MFHKIRKSGCKAEESKLRIAQRLTNLISLFCILSWRIFWMTMLNRSAPDAPPTLALTTTEIGVLDHLVNDKPKARQKALSHYLIKIARLGAYLARASDPRPGNTVMWRGLSRLTDIALGVMIGEDFVGNCKLHRTDTSQQGSGFMVEYISVAFVASVAIGFVLCVLKLTLEFWREEY